MRSSPAEPEAGSVVATREFTVEWGECDPLGIIFYPTYFRWIDASTHALFRQVGHDVRSLRAEFGLEGPVIVDTGASFVRPVSYGDRVTARAWIGAWNKKTFRVEHRFAHDDDTICFGHELRAWAMPDGTSPTGMKAEPVPDAFRHLFSA